jgi:Trk K+ transport system NAD-binding subunit
MLATHAVRYRIQEASVTSRSRVLGKKVAEAGLPAGTEILSLIREQQVFVPVNGTPFRTGDHVIALVRREATAAFHDRFR